MIEIERILNQFEYIGDDTYCLAEVVKVNGSSYRQPGAKMLINSGGSFWGSVSGGCLEGDALKQAKLSIKEKKTILNTYDTSDENNKSITRNLGCNGIIEVLFEPIDKNNILLNSLKTAYFNDQYLAIATIIDCDDNLKKLGKRFILDSSYQFFSNYENNGFNKIIEKLLIENSSSKRNLNKVFEFEGTKYSIFLELINPRLELIIFGSGFDTKPIIQIAKSLGWKVIITSDSYSITIPEDFAPADRIEYIDRDEISENIKLKENSYCVLISHNYKYDKKVLKAILKSNTNYIGILGPKKRYDMLKEELKAESTFTDNDFTKVYSPIGLEIGAENPDEIAISIISEILSVSKFKIANSLKFKTTNIHNDE